jgi:hypothetical protein
VETVALPETKLAAADAGVSEAEATEAAALPAPEGEPGPAPVTEEPAAGMVAAEPISAEVEVAEPQQAEAGVMALLPEAAAPEPAPEPTKAPVAPRRSKAIAQPAAARAASADPTSLPGMASFWQEQFERTVTAGQAIMVCRSPEEAVRLQLAYVQATVVSGIERVGLVTRWSQDMVRGVLPLPR